MTDPLTLVFMALSAMTSALLFVFRQWMVENDRGYSRLEDQCNDAKAEFKAEATWLKEQLALTQTSQVATLNLIAKAVETQGLGVAAIIKAVEVQGADIKAILERLDEKVDPHTTRRER